MLANRFHALIPFRTFVLLSLWFCLFTVGCGRKHTHPTPAVLVPSIEVQPRPEPVPETVPTEEEPAAQETAPPQTPQQEPKPRPKPRRPVPRKTVPPAQAEQPKTEQAKPTPDNSVQITADVPRAAVQSQRQNTEQLLRTSDYKLSHINRNLGDSEQGMLRQARNYIAQSNDALKGGDVERAYNLAVKASLLANELTK